MTHTFSYSAEVPVCEVCKTLCTVHTVLDDNKSASAFLALQEPQLPVSGLLLPWSPSYSQNYKLRLISVLRRTPPFPCLSCVCKLLGDTRTTVSHDHVQLKGWKLPPTFNSPRASFEVGRGCLLSRACRRLPLLIKMRGTSSARSLVLRPRKKPTLALYDAHLRGPGVGEGVAQAGR